MSLAELMPSVQSLSPTDKLELLRLLAGELREANSILPLEVGKEYPIWSPFDADEAALALQAILATDTTTR